MIKEIFIPPFESENERVLAEVNKRTKDNGVAYTNIIGTPGLRPAFFSSAMNFKGPIIDEVYKIENIDFKIPVMNFKNFENNLMEDIFSRARQTGKYLIIDSLIEINDDENKK